MCDTLTALSAVTGDGSMIFGKNSDREPNEPLIMIRVPAGQRLTGQPVKCTYIEIKAKEKINEVILMKPSWMWGAEMGINSKGLVIGNEAVFTKEKQSKQDALLGMDMLRLALEGCDTAHEAVDYIVFLLGQYGQGGKAGFTANLRYHNSFIISDKKESYVLETSGKFWASKKIDDFYSISNSLTLQSDYDKSNCEKGVRFKDTYDNKVFSFGSKGNERQRFTSRFLKENKGRVDVVCVMGALRSHCGNEKVADFRAGSMNSVCMHAGNVISSQTTGSMIVREKDDDIILWIANTSLPCVSLYKPFWFIDDYGMFFSEQEQTLAVNNWKRIERTRRAFIQGNTAGLADFLKERDKIEQELLCMASNAYEDLERLRIMQYAKEREQKIYEDLENCLAKNESVKKKYRNPYYSHYWKNQNKKLQ